MLMGTVSWIMETVLFYAVSAAGGILPADVEVWFSAAAVVVGLNWHAACIWYVEVWELIVA